MIKSVFQLIRAKQWIKNVLIFAPIFFSSNFFHLEILAETFVAFLCFCLVASAVYILNDILDIENDRIHPRKRHRPIASGQFSIKNVLLIKGVLLISGLAVMYYLSTQAFFLLLAYYLLNVLYCFYLKKVPIIDFLIISFGFIIRILIGGVISAVFISQWLIIMTFLLATFLAVAKRRDDVFQFERLGKKHRKVVEYYNLDFMDRTISIVASVIMVSYLIYVTSDETKTFYDNNYLYISALFVFIGILRYLQIIYVKQESDAPTNIIYRDHFIQITILLWIISYLLIIYK